MAAPLPPCRRPRIGLRLLLSFALLPLLALPWIGLRFVERMAELARDAQWETQQTAARSLAASLHERPDLFHRADELSRLPRGIEPVVPETLAAATSAGALRRPLAVRIEGAAPPSTLRVRIAIARSEPPASRVWLLVEADDERLVLPGDLDTSGGGPVVQPGDAVTVLVGAESVLMDALAADDRARATGSSQVAWPELSTRVPVPLEPTATGWRAEIELPADARLIRVSVVDVDYLGSRSIEARADSGLLLIVAPSRDSVRDAALRLRDRQLTEVLRALDRGSGRISLVDVGGDLLARRGELAPPAPAPADPVARLARLLLRGAIRIAPGDEARDAGPVAPVATALTGVPARSAVRLPSDGGMPAWLLSSAHPIWIGERVVGALQLEDSTSIRLSLAQDALEQLTWLVTAALAATAFALLTVATLAVSRIVTLRRAAESAIDVRGRVVGRVPRFRLRDEVDALAGSYNRVLARLREHQDYLSKLRGRLLHELRTPIMVIRSSLDNLAAETGADRPAALAYAQRAQAGAARLERIVSGMGEAGSLEAMLESSDLERVDLVALVGACVEGHRAAYPAARLRVESGVPAAPCAAVPEAIAQALDKLVANAVDFAEPGSEIVVSVDAAGRPAGWQVSVRNSGAPLPDAMSDSLFESMVSVRPDAGASSRGHLGLGLYLVRLIAEFHGGRAWARNVAGGVEVGFSVAA